MTKLIVDLALLAIAEHFVGFVGFFELFFGSRISGITVRMQLHGDATVGLFQVAVRDVSVNAQDFVIISLCHALPLTACPTTPIGVASYAVHDFA